MVFDDADADTGVQGSVPLSATAESRPVIGIAGLDDLDELVRLEAGLFREDAGRHDPFADVTWPEREGRADFERLLRSAASAVLVARLDGAVVGLLVGYRTASSSTRLPGEHGVIRSLFVDAAARRSGVGAGLVEAFLEWARRHGCVEVFVDHYVGNTGAGALYERLGLVPRSVSRSIRF